MRDDQIRIGEVLIRYASGSDQRDWPLFRTCWRHDVVADYDTLGSLSGVDAITDVMVAPGDSANWVEATGSADDVFVRNGRGLAYQPARVPRGANADGRRPGLSVELGNSPR